MDENRKMGGELYGKRIATVVRDEVRFNYLRFLDKKGNTLFQVEVDQIFDEDGNRFVWD